LSLPRRFPLSRFAGGPYKAASESRRTATDNEKAGTLDFPEGSGQYRTALNCFVVPERHQ
jgi:hypothetical protein